MRTLRLLSIIILLISLVVKGEESKEIKQEIILYNLVNGLHLEEKQIGSLLSCAKEVNEYRENLNRKIKELEKEEGKVLLSLKEEAKKEIPHPSQSLIKKFHEIKLKKAQLYKEFRSFLEKKAEEVKNILNETQLYLLGNFKPCVIPPKKGLRIGENSDKSLRFLERIRRLPSSIYEIRKDEIIQRFIERYKLLHPKVEEEKIEKMRDELEKIMEEAKALSDVEFSLKKNSFLERIKKIEQADKKIKIEEKIIRLLFNPSIIPVLEDIYSQKSE